MIYHVKCLSEIYKYAYLTHWGRVMHICVGNLTITGSDNGLPPGRCQAIIWTSAGILLIGPLGTNFSEILIGIQTFSFKKMHLKMSSAKWRQFCPGLNVLIHYFIALITRGSITVSVFQSLPNQQNVTQLFMACFRTPFPIDSTHFEIWYLYLKVDGSSCKVFYIWSPQRSVLNI